MANAVQLDVVPRKFEEMTIPQYRQLQIDAAEAGARVSANIIANVERADRMIQDNLAQAQTFVARIAAMAMQVPALTASIIGAWVVMHGYASSAKAAQLASFVPFLPAIGILLMMVLQARARGLYASAGRHFWAAIEGARERDPNPVNWDKDASHIAARNHMGAYRGAPNAVDAAVFWPYVAFTVMLGIEYFIANFMGLPTSPM